MYTLGIETSCDETSCAVTKGYRVLANSTISSLDEHKRYGGVVPEIATRAHLTNIDKVLNHALTQADIPLNKIRLIAVTAKPGLFGALVVGFNFAKALALGLQKPFIGINHLHAHIFAPFLNRAHTIRFPFLGVIISGGHTEFYIVRDFDDIQMIGQTRDDACGEVYDKIARALSLGYPGGPIIDKLFSLQHKEAFKFNCGKIGFDLSFSGIKTAVIYKAQQMQQQGKLSRTSIIQLVSSFQQAVTTTIVTTIQQAVQKYNVSTVVCGGGVIANSYLRQKLSGLGKQGIKVFIPEFHYCCDNAAIVAGLGFYLYNRKGLQTALTAKAEAN